MASRKKTRRYESPLREEQHDATRRALVDAMLAELRSGASELSMPAVAKRARVSIPTVYRHFPTRSDVNQAIFERVHELVPPAEHDPDDLIGTVKPFLEWRERVSEQLGAIAGSPAVWNFRREITVPRRRKHMGERVDALVPNLPEPQRTWLIDLLTVIFSDVMATALRGYLELDAEAGAKRLEWAVEALLAHGRRVSRNPDQGREK